MNADDKELMDNWLTRRDAEAFKTLCARYGGMVLATCRRVLRNAARAEEAAQDCLTVLATVKKAPNGPLGPWLLKAAVSFVEGKHTECNVDL